MQEGTFVVQSFLVLTGKKQKDKQKQNKTWNQQGKGEEGRGREGMFAVKEWWENHFYPT